MDKPKEQLKYRAFDVQIDASHGGRVVLLSDALAIVNDLEQAETSLKAATDWISDMRDREAACCPEDVGFDEYIGVLTKRIAALERQLADTREAIKHLDRMRAICLSEGTAIPDSVIVEVCAALNDAQSNPGQDTPWPLRDAVKVLIDAVEHLHDVHSCDTDGYEAVVAAKDAAKQWLGEPAHFAESDFSRRFIPSDAPVRTDGLGAQTMEEWEKSLTKKPQVAAQWSVCPACNGKGTGQGDNTYCGHCGGDGTIGPIDEESFGCMGDGHEPDLIENAEHNRRVFREARTRLHKPAAEEKQ